MAFQPDSGVPMILACTEVLQEALLPLLSARDLFLLSCTSRAVQHWVLDRPVQLWQVHQPLTAQCWHTLLLL